MVIENMSTLLTEHSQRAMQLDDELQLSRLQTIIRPIIEAWRDPAIGSYLGDFPSFRELLAIDKYPEYFLSREAWKLDEWSKSPLDAFGQDLRNEISIRTDVSCDTFTS